MNLSKYQDKNTMWHDRECKNGEPRSNNCWIYSAYSQYYAPNTINESKMVRLYANCTVDSDSFKYNRLPGKVEPVFSRDEVMGMLSVMNSHLLYRNLKDNYWNFCNFIEYKKNPLTVKTFLKAVKALFKARNEHRNYLWENRVEDAYPLLFRLPPHDIYYLKKKFGGKPNLLETVSFYADTLQTIYKGEKSPRMIVLFRLKELGSKYLIKLIDEKKYVKDYFTENHPFYVNLIDNKTL
jgi:hypothetical protein